MAFKIKKVNTMVKLKIKGHEIEVEMAKNSFNRRAVQLQNRIITTLQKIGVKRDCVDIELESMAGRKAKAGATWYGHGYRMHYSNNSQAKFVDNLAVVCKIIEVEVNRVLTEEKTLHEFIEEFKEDSDIDDKRKEAREFFGLEHDAKDIEIINKKYKELAKELHPDTPTGSTEKFKELNAAHKILKRELT